MTKDNDKLDLTRELSALRKGKKLYAISIVTALSLALFYAIFSSPVYHNEAVILIEKESGSNPLSNLLGGSSQMANLFSLSGLGSSTMDDELVILRSHDCFKNAVSNLGINRTYTERVGLRKKSLYGKSPVIVEAPKVLFDTITQSLKFTIELTGSSSAKVKVSTGFMGLTTLAKTESQVLPFKVETPYGAFQLLKTDYYSDHESQKGRTITVSLTRNDYVAETQQQLIKFKEVNKRANAVEIDFDIQDPVYGRDMLAGLIASYRMMRRQHKSDQSSTKLSFLDKRIEILSGQLDTAQLAVKDYMKDNKIIDVDTQSELLIKRATSVSDSIFSLKTQLNIHEAILKVIKDPSNQYQLLAQDEKSPLIKSYNELIMKRSEMLQSARPGNIMLENLEKQISEMRQFVVENSRQVIEHNKYVINSLSQHVGSAVQSLETMPTHMFEMLNNKRDLQLQNTLLVYLLQERENALLSMSSEDNAGFVIDQPYTAKKTVKTKIFIVSLILLVLAVACPTIWILWRMPRKKEDTLVA